tara:strand:+ start:9798 stop:10583 length:786 start_codon:yes stop_codon:yes gene_type:complete
MIDTHSHMYSEQFDEDQAETILRAKDKGIKYILLPNIDIDSIDALHKLAQRDKCCIPMMGLHPCSVDLDYSTQLKRICLELFQGSQKYIAVGEIGIDLYWDRSFIEQQKAAFRIQINWAKELAIPIVIHARDSMSEILEILDEENSSDLRGVFHCFSGTMEDAERIMTYEGFKFGIGGVVTFKNSTLPKVLKSIPLDYLLLETDAPYLAPMPHRGKRNESAYLLYIAEKLSDIYECPVEQIKIMTTQNAEALFRISKYLIT